MDQNRKSSRRRRNCLLRVRNFTLIFLTLAILFVFINSYESREGYLASPFLQPWIPAIMSSYRVKPPRENQDKSPFLGEFKNPCYLKQDGDWVFGEVLATSESDRKSTLRFPTRVQIEDSTGKTKYDVLRCLPYYFVLGWAKCGTTDLNRKMMAHPHILAAPQKEPAWFNNHRFSATEDFAPLNAYIDNYDFWVTSRMAMYFHRYGAQVPLVVGDHSTHTIDIYRGGDLKMENFKYSNSTAPKGTGVANENVLKQYSTPILIKQLVPHAKFVVIMRNPIDRIWSLYRMHEARSTEDFHNGVVDGINFWKACLAEQRPIGECLYYKLRPNGYHANAVCEWTSRAIGSLRRGIYYLYLAEWFSVFPKEQFLVLNFAEYAKNTSGVLNNKIFPFLDLPKLSGFNEMNMNARSRQGVTRGRPKKDGSKVQTWTGGDMLPETKKLLQDFYGPYNRELVKLLNDNSFLFS